MRQTDAMVMSGPATRSDPIPYSRLAAGCRVIAYLAAVSPLLLMLALAGLYRDLNRTEIANRKPVMSVADATLNREDLPNGSSRVQSPTIQSQTRPEKLPDSGNS
jgi:hypothetical protein